MNKSNFYKELYRFLEREDSGVWGWVNLSDTGYKNFDLELSNTKRTDHDVSYSSDEKELYPLRLKVRLKRFLYSYVKAAEKCGMLKHQIETNLNELGEICDALVFAYNKAAGGERSAAIDILSERIFKNIQFSDFNMVLSEMDYELKKKKRTDKLLEKDSHKEVCLYRMRPTEKYELFDENGMSHIPFNLSHRTNNERFSICGLPSLYLASSAYGCWMEMDCPRIETVNIALFKPENNIKFLDLCYPNENELYDKRRMMLLPIIVACDMPVKYPDANYKYEYTIPQLILESLVRYRNNKMNEQILGIRYISVKRKTANLAYPYKSFKRLYYNYVFPPVEIKYEGQCPVIKENFKFIKVTTCFHMQNVEHEMPISPKYNDQYEQGLFYRLECHLENQMLVYGSKSGALT